MWRGSVRLGGCEAVSPPIGEALAADALEGDVGALRVIDAKADTVGIAEVELGKVARKVLLAANAGRSRAYRA